MSDLGASKFTERKEETTTLQNFYKMFMKFKRL